MTHHKLQTTKFCFACGQERTNGNMVMFVPRMETYCKDMAKCGAPLQHIYNQIHEKGFLPEYQSRPVPCRYDEIYQEAERYFGKSSKEFQTLFKIIGKPASVRLDTNKAMFLAKYMEAHKFDTQREAFYHMMERIMKEDHDIVRKNYIAK